MMMMALSCLALAHPPVQWVSPDRAPVSFVWEDGDGALVSSNLPYTHGTWFTERVVREGVSPELYQALDERLVADGFQPARDLTWLASGAPLGVRGHGAQWIGLPARALTYWPTQEDGQCVTLLTSPHIDGVWAGCRVGPTDEWVLRRLPEAVYRAAQQAPAICLLAPWSGADGVLYGAPDGRVLPDAVMSHALDEWVCDASGHPRWLHVALEGGGSGWMAVDASLGAEHTHEQ